MVSCIISSASVDWGFEMTKTVVAIFDGDVLRPETSLDLEPNSRYQITIEPVDEAVEGKVEDAWSTLSRLAGSVDAPTDWSVEHDHYLYDTPKRHRDASA
jgi:hypothetical protein